MEATLDMLSLWAPAAGHNTPRQGGGTTARAFGPAPAPAADEVPDYDPLDEKRRQKLLSSLNSMSAAELTSTARKYDTTGVLLKSPLLKNPDVLRLALHDFLSAVDEESTDDPDTVDAWLSVNASPWPADEPRPPPQGVAQALAADGPWGAAACGVEVRLCRDDPGKGRGAFATREIRGGMVVGVYAGEELTQREHAIRHDASRGTEKGGPKMLPVHKPLTASERAALSERRQRISLLTADDGAPMGGATNGGSYSFALLPDTTSTIFPGRVAYIDAEDPHRSNWARYVNHAPEESRRCNAEPHIDAVKKLIWLQARRDIAAGE
mmetsp:Transcript_825/g.2268  ORF Transcript_825/g.2268 Transcript_825/m.2268 type:complete len:324 (-) Transcript_825:11-982(-)